ncbi:UPF0538 protein C2orf76 homolog [Tigriopus californicus]|uniref:UPF0538 protein C2orf76 homolog n=1 Tax=Tigriopus californicus TaxID=6832 RepID=UPI0027DA9DBC|nr:UPF0538 protein C2orf76 homolog [Tigriopus californicus]|eukprot:TCALIF_07558-PB protein Name:"Similar to zgc:101851 UPF0538 protein C2orf76 homolog (Danio rerio)" AED:0.22 eAED:0.22 QI:227/1/1/1/1/1/2/420/140
MAETTTHSQPGIVCVRLIRSFQHRNIRHLVLKDVDWSQTVERFMVRVLEHIKTAPGLPPPFRKFDYDCMKIEHQAHGAKTSDPVINRSEDDLLILKPDQTLAEGGVKHETEIALFKRADYMAYQAHPDINLVHTMNPPSQ